MMNYEFFSLQFAHQKHTGKTIKHRHYLHQVSQHLHQKRQRQFSCRLIQNIGTLKLCKAKRHFFTAVKNKETPPREGHAHFFNGRDMETYF